MLANRSGVCRKHLTALRYHLQGLKVPVGHRLLHQRPHLAVAPVSRAAGTPDPPPPAPPPAGRPATPPDPAPPRPETPAAPSASPCCPSHLPTGPGWPRSPAPQSYRRRTLRHHRPRSRPLRNSGFTPSRCASWAKTRTARPPALASPTLGQRFFIGPLRRRVPPTGRGTFKRKPAVCKRR